MARPNSRIVNKEPKVSINPEINKIPVKSVDIIVSSGIIRNLFLERCQELKVSPYTIGKLVGISPEYLKREYIKNTKPKATYKISQGRLLKMLKIVGVDVRVLLSVVPIDKHKEWLKLKGINLTESNQYDPDQKFDTQSKWCGR